MTALAEYDRLESSGLWRVLPDAENPDADAKRREVIVSFGNATIVLSDQNDKPLAHWAMAAIRRQNAGKRPAIYSPDKEAGETLEIDDDAMIDAIEKIRAAINRQRPKPGRLRWGLLGGLMTATVALSVFWLPNALVRHTVSVIPTAKRLEIGQSIVNNIKRISGQACTSTYGSRALDTLALRLDASSPPKLIVLPSGVTHATHLPGGFILLNHELFEDFEEPDVAAGYIIAEQFRAQKRDPLEPLLRTLGLRSTFTLLTTGKISDADLSSYAEHLLTSPQPAIDPQELLLKFLAANTRSTPYAYGVDPTGETTLELIEADPFASLAAIPLLTDEQWINLQSICED
ncbi:hypothetical protein JI58_01190 [Marinosulfonomonas sp. PRT-SC04]|nr:hypothetical protein JI58_01190 [Marinosulfonomonas sp. PRT-SC04]